MICFSIFGSSLTSAESLRHTHTHTHSVHMWLCMTVFFSVAGNDCRAEVCKRITVPLLRFFFWHLPQISLPDIQPSFMLISSSWLHEVSLNSPSTFDWFMLVCVFVYCFGHFSLLHYNFRTRPFVSPSPLQARFPGWLHFLYLGYSSWISLSLSARHLDLLLFVASFYSFWWCFVFSPARLSRLLWKPHSCFPTPPLCFATVHTMKPTCLHPELEALFLLWPGIWSGPHPESQCQLWMCCVELKCCIQYQTCGKQQCSQEITVCFNSF